MRLILAACKTGMAAVAVTHDAQMAPWADRVTFLRDGRVTDRTVPSTGPSFRRPPPRALAPPLTTVLERVVAVAPTLAPAKGAPV